MKHRLSSEALDWLCRFDIARTANEPLTGIPPNVARELTMLHGAQLDSCGEYTLAPADASPDGE